MARITGIGGIFFKAQDPKALGQWYAQHLGLDVQPWGGATLRWGTAEQPTGTIAWNLAGADTACFEPSAAPFMVNYRVDDLASLLESLRSNGCNVLGGPEESEYGKFGWVLDPEGNKVELWEPLPGS
ncbi:VOC family protein [Rhodanobacter glycinis]|uniref:Glyoxalase/Bleomycin resistance protein/Dioxygenase superfamily protein n=1 Tax=Rhodanobacter glycinis TaxID=582702 RepID=A0A1I3ZN30_9GAMM|nr:VOC family protein [Rhodanobacter glycinis]SFK44949.1 Glyoxalase/Bleomycin resistance protein/Dioxygenase superfamily protein [Rhodanobacter glycinis]